MPTTRDRARLEDEHTPSGVAARLRAAPAHSYLGDGVLGAIDGTVTTFAIVAGASGAGLAPGIALVLGLANVVADGFSMAASNYLKAKSDRELVDRARRAEEHHVAVVPEGEREEIRQLFAAKGFSGEVLETVVETITANRAVWIDTMLTEEHGLRLETPEPRTAALVTFLAFVGAGFLPLAPLLLALGFGPSAAVTALAFCAIGLLKGRATERSLLVSAAETLLVGGAAAALAYLAGGWAKGLAAL